MSAAPAVACLAITRRAAQQAAVAAIEEAERLGVSVNVAVVDRSGVLMAFLRMPDASLHSIDVAMDSCVHRWFGRPLFTSPGPEVLVALRGFSFDAVCSLFGYAGRAVPPSWSSKSFRTSPVIPFSKRQLSVSWRTRPATMAG